jgi:hypothetical protein
MTNTWDEKKNNKPSLMLDLAITERIAATDPVVAQLIADIDAEFAAGDSARESAKEHIFNRGESYSRPSTN